MENKVLNTNLDALKKYDKHLADEILRINKTKSTFELIQNKNGEYNLIKNSIPLHSLVGAQTEAQKIIEKIPDISEKNTIRIIWGLGLGYLADEFISRSNGAIIIYEPDIELLRVVFEMVEFEKNLQKSNVFLTNDPKKLLKMLDMLSDKETKITISFLSSYLSLYKNEIYKTAEFVEKTRGEKQANINTINKLGPLATINTLSNIRKIISTPLVSSLKDIYKDKTALVASAGPSLAENIETIKKNREKFVLFAVGPSLKLLNKNGIEPDFLCIAEAMDTSAQIEGICLENINLIFEPFSNSYLWDLKTKNKFLYFSKDNFLDDWLANVLEINISNNKTIGTVSYLALSSAKTMGFKKIILCGQDLAFKDGKCYAKGSAYEDLECILNPDTNKYEIIARNYESYKHKLLSKKYIEGKYADYYTKNYIKKLNSTIYTVKGQNGQILPTQACYAIFIKHFENFAKENSELELINSSAGGAQIDGFINLPLDKVLNDCPVIEKMQIPVCTLSYNYKKIDNEIANVIKIYKNIIDFTCVTTKYQQDLIRELSLRKSLNKTAQKIQQKIIDILNKLIENYSKYPFAIFLFSSYTNRYFANLRKIKESNELEAIKKLQNNNLKLLNAFTDKCHELLNGLSDK